jgi:hypothetical protein
MGIHNPILNPVGSSVPIPADKPLYRAKNINKTLGF